MLLENYCSNLTCSKIERRLIAIVEFCNIRPITDRKLEDGCIWKNLLLQETKQSGFWILENGPHMCVCV
jgi:hypothetical protein